jgi:hypothetical protein
MGDVIDFPIRPFNALNLGDVEIVRLCGDCIKAGATECKSAECGFFSPDR